MKLKYTMVIEPTNDPEFFGVYIPDLPGCTATGDSIQNAIDKGLEAIEEHIEILQELDKPIPKDTFRPIIKILQNEGDDPPEWVKISQASQILGVSESTVRRYIKNGNLPAYRLSRDYQFDISDLKRFIGTKKVA